MNTWDQFRAVISESERIDSAASDNAYAMGLLLLRNGNMRRLTAEQLRTMKRALRDFDMTTGEWKR